MKYFHLFVFITAMWILLILGGAILVNVVAPISVGLEDRSNPLVSSVVKAAIAVVLVVVWILILTMLKNWIFRKQIA